jgi:hypothetical protein
LEVVTLQLDPDFREFVESFNDHEVRYLVVGGYALAAHGVPRATGDLDAWVAVGDDNAERVVAALTAFGFGSLGLEIADFDHPDSIVQLEKSPCDTKWSNLIFQPCSSWLRSPTTLVARGPRDFSSRGSSTMAP